MLADAVKTVSQAGADPVVRINRPIRHMVKDVEAAVKAGARCLFVTKVDGAGHLKLVAELVEECEREVIIELPDDELGTVPMQNVSPRLSGTPGTIRTPAPKRGEHSRAVLEELGYGADDIEQLKEKGVVEG